MPEDMKEIEKEYSEEDCDKEKRQQLKEEEEHLSFFRWQQLQERSKP